MEKTFKPLGAEERGLIKQLAKSHRELVKAEGGKSPGSYYWLGREVVILQLLDILTKGNAPRTLADIQKLSPISQPHTYRALKFLEKAGLVRRVGELAEGRDRLKKGGYWEASKNAWEAVEFIGDVNNCFFTLSKRAIWPSMRNFYEASIKLFINEVVNNPNERFAVLLERETGRYAIPLNPEKPRVIKEGELKGELDSTFCDMFSYDVVLSYNPEKFKLSERLRASLTKRFTFIEKRRKCPECLYVWDEREEGVNCPNANHAQNARFLKNPNHKETTRILTRRYGKNFVRTMGRAEKKLREVSARI